MARRPIFEQLQPWYWNGTGTSNITFPNTPAQELTAQSGLIGARCFANTTLSQYMLATCDSAAGNGVIARLGDNGSGTASKFTFNADSTGTALSPVATASSASGEEVPYKKYCDYGWSWDGTLAANMFLYQGIEGQTLRSIFLETADAGTGSLKLTGQPLIIGNRPGFARTFSGEIYYVARWNRVLAGSELRLAQECGPLAVLEGLVFFWTNRREWISGLAPSAETQISRGAFTPFARPFLIGYMPGPAASGTTNASIAATDSSDTASITAAIWTTAQIAATETSDSAAINAGATTPASIAATESSDTAAITAEVTTGAAIAATETSDTASITASAITSGQIAATDSSDTASVSASVTTGAAIAASESSDTAAIVAATITNAQIAATDSSDTVSINAAATTSATIAATESSDTAAITADATGVLSATIAATESSDTVAIAASVTTGAAIDATESPDTAAIVGSGGAVDTGVSHGPIPPRQRPHLVPIIGHAHTGQAQTVRATVTLKLVVSIKTAQVQSVEAIADQSIDVVGMTEQAHRISGFGWARMLTSARTAQAPPVLSAILAQEMQTKIVSGIFDREVPSYDAPERIVFRDVA